MVDLQINKKKIDYVIIIVQNISSLGQVRGLFLIPFLFFEKWGNKSVKGV